MIRCKQTLKGTNNVRDTPSNKTRHDDRRPTAWSEAPDIPPDEIPGPETQEEPTFAETAEAPQDTIVEQQESPQDTELRYTDAEILGKRYPVRRAIREAGNQRIAAIESAKARWQNARDTPAKLRLGLSQSVTKGLLDRQLRKFEEVKDLPANSRLRRRREKKLLNAQARHTKAKNAYDTHTGTMKDRVDAVGRNKEARRDTYIAELRLRREKALARKTMRHELRSQGASWLETRAIIKDIPKEHLDRVGAIAASAATSTRLARQTERRVSQSAKQETKLTQSLETNRAQAQQYAGEARAASDTLQEIQDIHLPAAEQRVGELRAQISELADDDNIGLLSLTSQLQEAEQQVKIYQEREIPYWHSVAEESRRKVAELDSQHDAGQEQLRTQKAATAQTSETADSYLARASREAAARDAAAQEASNE